MTRKLTYKKWLSICLLFLLCIQYAYAQYPKLLSQYPIATGTGTLLGGINTLTQKGNVVYIGGNFTELGQKPVVFSYGFAFDQVGSASPNPNFAQPHAPNNNVATAIPDGVGGFYIFSDLDFNVFPSTFTQVDGATRSGVARINADGTLNDWGAGVTISNNLGFLAINTAVKVGNTVLIGIDNGNAAGITALDATTGQVQPGWDNLALPSGWVHKMIVNGNKLYVLALNNTDFKQNLVAAIDISDITHPSVISSFKLDAMDANGAPLSIVDMALADNTLYLSGYKYNSNTNLDYQSQTLSGQVFNSSLFAVDATTGTFAKAFATPLMSSDIPASLALDGNKLYFTYHSDANSKLLAYDTQTGADISNVLPSITMTSSKTFVSFNGGGADVPYTSYNRLTVTSDHKLIIYGGFDNVNSINQTVAAIDLTANTLIDWHPSSTVSADNDVNTYIGPSTITESNGKIYVGGAIKIQQAPSSRNSSRNGLAAFNATTGEILPWSPADLTGTFSSMSIAGNTLYIGGEFSSSDGSGIIENLAAYDITDPNNPVLKTDWTPNPDDAVNALAINGTTLFAGGNFLHITGQARKRLAAFDISGETGALSSWNPGADNNVNVLLVSNNMLYAGGTFLNIGTTARSLAAAFDFSAAGAGQLTAWDPKATNPLNPNIAINAFTYQPADGTNHAARIFIGGSFSQTGTNATSATNLAAVNPTTGEPDAWQLPNGLDGFNQINGLTIANNKLYGAAVNLATVDVSNNFAPTNADVLLTNAGAGGSGMTAVLSSNNLLFAGGTFINANDATQAGLAVFQIADIAPLITFADITNTYGDTPFAPTATSTVSTNPITYSIADGDNPDNVISIADGKVTILKPGVATITASQTGAADVKAKITINKAVLTVVPKDATTVVNQASPDFPFTLTGWKNGDDTKSGIYTGKPVFTSTGTPTSPAGTYDLTVSGAGTLTSDYYTFTPSTAKATLTINTTGNTAQTITFAALPAKTYGDADITLGATTSAAGLSVMYKSSDDNVATVTGNKLHISGAGTVTITASQAGDPTYAPAADVPQTLTIAKAALTIAADDKIINRGDQLPAFTATYTGFVNGDAATDLDTPPTFITTATQASNPGSYPIMVSNAASDNYNITYVNGTLTIKGTQIITFAPVSTLTYGDAPFDPNASSDAGTSFKPVYTTSNPSVIAISGGQAVIKGAGTAAITATFAAANGFELTTATENITIQPKALTATADDKTKNFGDPLPALTVTYNGFVNNDTYTTPGVFSTPPVAATTATATSPAGTYPITVNGGVSTNYTLSYFPGTLTVVPVARTITFNALPNKTYGDADFNPVATSNTGEQATYTVADPTVATVTGNQIHITGAGSTTITATFPANSGYTGAATATQTLTVAKTKLTITADNLTKTQGPPDITLTTSYSGFVNSDNQLNLTTRPTLTTTANVNSPTGTYPITVSGASSPNYDITYVNGTLTIIFGVGQDQIVIHPMLSPNGDGKNDFMLIDGIQNYPDNHVLVVNRNGAKVYEARGYDNSSIVFSGKNSSGNSLVAGTYYYEVNYTLKGNTQRKAGYIIIKY